MKTSRMEANERDAGRSEEKTKLGARDLMAFLLLFSTSNVSLYSFVREDARKNGSMQHFW